MGLELKDLFSEKRILIAVGISESGTEATIWQTAIMVYGTDNNWPVARGTRWDKSIGLSHTFTYPEKEASLGSLGRPPSWLCKRQASSKENEMFLSITINKWANKAPCDKVKDISGIFPSLNNYCVTAKSNTMQGFLFLFLVLLYF